MISFRHFALRRGSRLLLSDIDLVIQSGWRLGVIGRNGCGKSSLFAALQGSLESDAGDLDMPAKLRLASVSQETPALPDAAKPDGFRSILRRASASSDSTRNPSCERS